MSAQKSLAKNAVFNFIKCFSNIIFPIISFPYASRILLPQGIGAVNFANSTVEYFILIAELGIGTYAAREAARIRDDKTAATKLSKTVRELITSVSTMQLLSFSIVTMSLNSYLSNLILTPNKLERFMLYAQLISLFVNLSLNYFFIKKWGVFGAGFATLIVESVLPAVKLIPSWKYIKDKSNLINMIKALLGSALMFCLIYFAFSNIENNLLKISISVSAGAVLYAIIEIVLKHPTAIMILGMIAKKLRK